MSPAGAPLNPGQFVVSAEAVTHEVPAIIAEELQSVLTGTGLGVIVQDDWQAAVLPGSKDPHI